MIDPAWFIGGLVSGFVVASLSIGFWDWARERYEDWREDRKYERLMRESEREYYDDPATEARDEFNSRVVL